MITEIPHEEIEAILKEAQEKIVYLLRHEELMQQPAVHSFFICSDGSEVSHENP